MHLQLGLLAMALVAMAGFAAHQIVSGRDSSERVRRQGRSLFLGSLPMEFGYWVLSPIGRLAARWRISPHLLSWTCLVGGAASGVAAGLGAVPLAGALSIVSACFDMLDGMVARSRGVASDAGEVLDAAVDRYSEFFLLGGLCLYYRQEPWAMILVLGALLGSLLVSYSQAKAEAMQATVPKGWMRRPERAAYLGAAAFLSPIVTVWFEAGDPRPLHYPLLGAIALVAVFANITAVWRFVALYRIVSSRARPGFVPVGELDLDGDLSVGALVSEPIGMVRPSVTADPDRSGYAG